MVTCIYEKQRTNVFPDGEWLKSFPFKLRKKMSQGYPIPTSTEHRVRVSVHCSRAEIIAISRDVKNDYLVH